MAKLIDITGKAISGEWGNDDDAGTGIPVLRTTNFTNDGVINYNNVVTRDIQKKDLSQKFLQPGDIIIEKSGGSDKQPVGRVVYYDGEPDRFLFNNFTGALRVRDKSVWYPRYVFYALYGNYVKGGTRRYENKTTGLHNLKTDQYVQDFTIQEQPLEHQQQIVSRLDKVIELIALRKEQLAKLDELVNARFVEMFEDGESPIKTVEEVCSAIVDCPHTTPKYEGELKNPAIRTAEIKKGHIEWETMRYVSDEEYEERTARLKPEAGDIVYGREGTFGNAAILPKGYNFCLGQRVMLLRPDYSKCTSEYLLYAVISDDVYRQALEKNNASTVAHVNVKDVKQFRIPLPSFDKQNQFATFVDQIDKTKLTIQKSLDKLEVMKKALMQEYFG